MNDGLYEIVHKDDHWLVREQDIRWMINLGENGVQRLSTQDDVARTTSFLMHLDDGLSEEEAGRLMRRAFPLFYLHPIDREIKNTESDEDSKLPFPLKKRLGVFKLIKIKKNMTDAHTSFNACVRDLYRRGILK